MPYFVFRVETDPASGRKDLTHLDTVDHFKAARQIVRTKRAASEDGSPDEFRMIFAHNQAEAERLLTATRTETVVGED